MKKPTDEMLELTNLLAYNEIRQLKAKINKLLYCEENEFAPLNSKTIYGLSVFIDSLIDTLNILEKCDKNATIKYREINNLR